MNQPQPVSPSQGGPTPKQKSYLKLLLIVLGVVIIGSGLYYYFGIYKGVKSVTSVSSPTPTKSAAVSPSGATETSTPASGTTTSTNEPSSPAASPQTPPEGWKLANTRIFCAGPCYADFSVFIKEDWKEHQNTTAHTAAYFTSNDQCQVGYNPSFTENCFDHLIVGLGDPNNDNLLTKSYPLGNVYNDQPSTQYPKIYVSVNKSISSSDQSLILDSFKVTQ